MEIMHRYGFILAVLRIFEVNPGAIGFYVVTPRFREDGRVLPFG